ncbi:hypothetical protein AYL99_09036 [Fonsecaea erecta]|uniref:RRM domain-containing protein n=1 Tax=Fonsecaea erecta TaxID=1367422 RepID=A0A178ZAW4_9EURO|nr:hypothetical protein AYL99_09036 [Fonsecaea erecta]OAP56924.1 hypothetical protein AYL99_09036 [Fonsecaea erecta]
MDGQQGFGSWSSDDQDHDHDQNVYQLPPGYVRIPYPSVAPFGPPPLPPVNFHPGLPLPQPQQPGFGGINLNGTTMGTMNGGAMPTASLPTMQLPSIPNFYLPNNNDPFAVAGGAVYTPAQPVRVVNDPGVPFDPSTPPPFADRAQLQFPRRHGVLKIENIPYTISIPEMQQFVCKYIPSSHLIEAHVAGCPIHIIMERSTGKTMDCYVEIIAPHTAAQDWEHAFGLKLMRIPKIGQRNVEVTLSNQGELMKDMFPRAKCIHFDAEQFGAPRLVPNRDIFSSGYKGFMTNEELTCMVRHAEYPQRSQFANRSMQRTFESMISTLYKFPWFSVKLYTLRQIQAMFDAYKKQLDVLIVKVDSSRGITREVGLDNKLLMDFVFAGLNAPGFSERQRADIVESSQALACGFRISKHARYWPFQTLSTHPANLSDQDVGMWLNVLNMGMGVMESQNRKFIGVEPYLEVIRDADGHVLFQPTEQGLDLKRGQFSAMEKRYMHGMMQLGWHSFMDQMGMEPPTHTQNRGMHTFNDSFIVGSARIDPVNPFTGDGSSNRRPGDLSNNNSNGRGDDNFEDEDETQGLEGNIDNPEQAHLAMREVLRQVHEAPPARQQASMHRQSGYEGEVEGLGAGLQHIESSAGGNGPGPTIIGPLLPQHPARSRPVLGRPFNPETPAFEPPPSQNPRRRHTPSNSDSTLGTGPVFGGSGIGNGDFTSPQRISTARNNVRGNGREPAAAAAVGSGAPAPAAAGIRLRPTAPIYGSLLPVALGRADAVTAQPALFQVPSGRERRGVTIRPPNDGRAFTTLGTTSVLDTGTVGGPNPLTLSPEEAHDTDHSASDTGSVGSPHSLTLSTRESQNTRRPTLETGSVGIPHTWTSSPREAQNTIRADGVDELDEFLDELFGETTTQADRVAMRGGFVTPTSSPVTAPASPLRRVIGRVPSGGIGQIEDDYDDGEVVNRSAMSRSSPGYTIPHDESSSPFVSTSPEMSSSPGVSSSSLASSSPVVSSSLDAARNGAPEYRGPGSGWEGYMALSQDPPAPMRDPLHLTIPGIGDLAEFPYPQRMTILEGTAEARDTRLTLLQQRGWRIHETIDEEPEPSNAGQ